MRKFNFTLSLFLYSLLVYLFYIIFFVFVKKDDYISGIYYFTPSFIFTFWKLFNSGIKKIWPVAVFVAIPFIISFYLSFRVSVPGWEVSGFIPVAVLTSYLFKSSENGSTPLKIIYLNRIIWIFLLSILFFALIHFFKTGSLEKALYLAVSIYSPAPVIVTTALFINFIISTAAISAVLNNLDFFNKGTLISRLIFDTDSFLTFPQLNLSGIETVKGVSAHDFLDLVEKLNAEAESNTDYAETVKKNKLYSRKFEDGTTLSMAPLKIMISSGNFKNGDLNLPENNDDRSFVALAKEDKIIGYYAIDMIKPSTNASFLEVFDKKYGVKSIISNPKQPNLWKKSAETATSLNTVQVMADDLIITENCNENCIATQITWGATNFNKGDIFIAKPFLSTIHNLILISKNIKNRLIKGVILCSFPFSISLFSVSFGLMIPQISAVSVMFSFVFTMLYIFYVKPVSKK